MQDLQEKRKIDAAQIKADSRKAKKQIEKQEKNYLKKAINYSRLLTKICLNEIEVFQIFFQ